MDKLEDKIQCLYQFLKENRQYNKEVQTNTYKRILLPFDNREEKVIALLHHVVQTQSQPKIDKLALFFQKIQKYRSELSTLKGFLKVLDSNQKINYNTLFQSLQNQDGWGSKTSALFCKSVFHLHCSDYDKDFEIWQDAPKTIENEDKFYLPVDAVIIEIFSRLNFKKNNFKGINNFLNNDKYKSNDIEVWDDLWFWGFISQKTITNSNRRELGWNEAKYWILLETNKNQNTIQEIKSKTEEFIKILT